MVLKQPDILFWLLGLLSTFIILNRIQYRRMKYNQSLTQTWDNPLALIPIFLGWVLLLLVILLFLYDTKLYGMQLQSWSQIGLGLLIFVLQSLIYVAGSLTEKNCIPKYQILSDEIHQPRFNWRGLTIYLLVYTHLIVAFLLGSTKLVSLIQYDERQTSGAYFHQSASAMALVEELPPVVPTFTPTPPPVLTLTPTSTLARMKMAATEVNLSANPLSTERAIPQSVETAEIARTEEAPRPEGLPKIDISLQANEPQKEKTKKSPIHQWHVVKPAPLPSMTPTPAPTSTPTFTNPEYQVTAQWPPNGFSTDDKVTFQWDSEFTPTAPYAFELVLWKPGQLPLEDGFGLRPPSQEKRLYVHLFGLKELLGGHLLEPGEYLWGVLLVQTEPAYKRLAYLGGGQRFRYDPRE